MSHGVPNGYLNSPGTITNGCVVESINVIASNHSIAAIVTIFEKNRDGNISIVDIVQTAGGEAMANRHYGSGIGIANEMQMSTSANVSWANVEYRYWAG